MYVNTETGKDVCVWQWIRKQISESVYKVNIKYKSNLYGMEDMTVALKKNR